MTLCFSLSWVNKVWPRNLKKWWIVCKLGRVLLESALIKNSSHNAFSFPCNLPELPLTQALLQLSTRSEIPKLQKSFEGKEERQKSIKRGEQKEGKSNLWHENLIKTHPQLSSMWRAAAVCTSFWNSFWALYASHEGRQKNPWKIGSLIENECRVQSLKTHSYRWEGLTR